VLEAISKLKLKNSKNHLFLLFLSFNLLMASNIFDINSVVFKNYKKKTETSPVCLAKMG